MKSRIRSRWHRANEKPLENDGSPTPTAPFGEIDPSNNATLTDDLSNYKPSENSQSSRPHQKQSSNMDERRGNRSRGDNRKPRQRRDRKDDTRDGETQSSDNNHSGKNRNPKNRKPRKRKGNENRDRSPRGDQEKSRNHKNKNRRPNKPADKESSKPSGLKGFISKLFG